MTGPTPRRADVEKTLRVVATLAVPWGLTIRFALLPSPGYADDITEFAGWVRHIALNGVPNAYDQPITFGPVMVYVWGLLAALEPGFRAAVDGSDAAIRILLKLPAAIADFGLVGAAAYALRDRPKWAAAAVTVILLHPAIWFLSAWWGQYESVYALLALVAFALAIRDRFALATLVMAGALMTKPQVLPLLVPFGAFVLARVGWRSRASVTRLVGLAAIGLGTIVILWLPFVASGGPGKYLEGVVMYQDDRYSVLSLNAWNLWWLVQEFAAGGALVGDQQAFIGPLTFRAVGYALAGVLLLFVLVATYRRPTPRQLALGMATAALVAFTFLTTMHERYGYAAVVFLAVLVDDRRVRWLVLAFGVAFFLNLVAAASANYLGGILPVTGLPGIAGSVVTVGAALAALAALLGRSSIEDAELSGGRTPPDTSAGSAGATSGA